MQTHVHSNLEKDVKAPFNNREQKLSTSAKIQGKEFGNLPEKTLVISYSDIS